MSDESKKAAEKLLQRGKTKSRSISVNPEEIWPEFEQFQAIVKRIHDTNWWNWADMQEMEALLPGLTEGVAEAYGVNVEAFQEILSNGKGFYLTPEIKNEFLIGFL